MGFPSDLEIARGAQLRPLSELAAESGIPADCLELYGEGVAKVRLDAIEAYASQEECRAQMLRSYFGVVSGSECGACDMCRQAGERPGSFFEPLRKKKARKKAGKRARKKARAKKGSAKRGRRRGTRGRGRPARSEATPEPESPPTS